MVSWGSHRDLSWGGWSSSLSRLFFYPSFVFPLQVGWYNYLKILTGKTIYYLCRRQLSQFAIVLYCVAACLRVYWPLVFVTTVELNGNSCFFARLTKDNICKWVYAACLLTDCFHNQKCIDRSQYLSYWNKIIHRPNTVAIASFRIIRAVSLLVTMVVPVTISILINVANPELS